MRTSKVLIAAFGLFLSLESKALFGQVVCQVIVPIECGVFSESTCRDTGSCTVAPGYVSWRCTTGLLAQRSKAGTFHGVTQALPSEAGFFSAVHGSYVRCRQTLECDTDCVEDGIFENTWWCQDKAGAVWTDAGDTYVTLTGADPCTGS